MILKNVHKMAARYLMMGMKPTVIASRLNGVTPEMVKRWRLDLDFKKYMFLLENKYMELLEKDLDHLRRSATARLQEVLEIPYSSKQFNMKNMLEAVNMAFQITLLKDRAAKVQVEHTLGEGRVAETPEQKAALKELVLKTGDPSRYGYNRIGEA